MVNRTCGESKTLALTQNWRWILALTFLLQGLFKDYSDWSNRSIHRSYFYIKSFLVGLSKSNLRAPLIQLISCTLTYHLCDSYFIGLLLPVSLPVST